MADDINALIRNYSNILFDKFFDDFSDDIYDNLFDEFIFHLFGPQFHHFLPPFFTISLTIFAIIAGFLNSVSFRFIKTLIFKVFVSFEFLVL